MAQQLLLQRSVPCKEARRHIGQVVIALRSPSGRRDDGSARNP